MILGMGPRYRLVMIPPYNHQNMSTHNLNNTEGVVTRASSLIIFASVALVGVACSSGPTDQPIEALVAAPGQIEMPAQAQPAASATIAQALPTPTLESSEPISPTQVEVAALPTAIPGLASAPAPPDQFRADPAHLIGATGKPQLVEIFAYW